jgi:T-complex protein 1 subunit theta
MYAKNVEVPHGIDVSNGGVKPISELKVYDCWDTKSWGVKLTSDVVLTILKVDQIIMSKPSGGPNFESQAARRPDGYDD